MAAIPAIGFEVAPFMLSGVVYGTLLNHRSALDELGTSVTEAPYHAAPRAPVLYLKPRNTLAVTGDRIEIPAGVDELELGGCLGIVIGRTACRLAGDDALDYVAGFVIVNDVSIPHAVFHRPSIRFKAHDGFCPLGPRVTARDALGSPDALIINTYVDGVLEQTASSAGSVRGVAQLLVDVTEFMTLSPGDILTLGVARPPPRVRAGQSADVEIAGLGRLSNSFAAAAS